MKKVMAMVHSLNAMAEVQIVSEHGCNDVIAIFDGITCHAIYNGFTGCYYVDDKYGVIAVYGGGIK